MFKWLTLLFLFLSKALLAQLNPVTLEGLNDKAYQQNDILISGGVSLAYFYGEDYPYATQRGSMPPLSANIDYAITDFLSAGIFGGYIQRLYTLQTNAHEYAVNNYIFGIRSSFHYLPLLEKAQDADLFSDRLDLYISVMGGYRMTEFMNIGLEENSRILGGATAGARYYLYRGFGIFAEAGYGIFGYGTVGLQFRL